MWKRYLTRYGPASGGWGPHLFCLGCRVVVDRGGHGRHPKGLSFCMTCEKMPRKLNQSHASFFSKMGPAPPRGRPDRPLPVAPLPVPTARRRIPGLVYLGPRAQGIQWLCRLYAPRGYLSRLAVCSVWCWTGSSCISSLVLVMRGARVHMYVICFQLVVVGPSRENRNAVSGTYRIHVCTKLVASPCRPVHPPAR